MTVPVTVVTGFLGAGKTTLLERWLGELPRERTAVIVNEQGAVGIDGELLAARAARLREIAGGCVCCETQAELDAALAELAESTPPLARIFVETSGAASPAGVVRALTRGRARAAARLDGVVAVIDATRADRALARDLAIEQLAFADVVVLSHADRASDADLDALARRLEPHAPAARVVRARRGAIEGLDLTAVLAQRDGVLRILPIGTRHAAIESVALVHDGALDEARFGDWVEHALGDVEARSLRGTGILAMAGVEERVILPGVGEAIEVTLGAPWGDAPRASRLVVLGLGLDADALEASFAACVRGSLPRPR